MFRMLIHPSSGACDYLVRYCVGCIVLTWDVLVLCSGIGFWWCDIRVQPTLGYHITNRQSRYITPTRLKSAQYSLHNNAPSSHKLLRMDVLTSETLWAVNWHNKASVIKLVCLYSKEMSVWCFKHPPKHLLSGAATACPVVWLKHRLWSEMMAAVNNCCSIWTEGSDVADVTPFSHDPELVSPTCYLPIRYFLPIPAVALSKE